MKTVFTKICKWCLGLNCYAHHLLDDVTYVKYKTLQLRGKKKKIRTPQNFGEGSSSIKSAQIFKNTRVNF